MTDDDLDLDAELRGSLSRARDLLEPQAERREELFNRIAPLVALPALPGAELGPTTPAGSPLVPAAWGKVIVASVIATAVGGTAALAPWSTPQPAAPPPAPVARPLAPVSPARAPKAEEAPPLVEPPAVAHERPVSEPRVDPAPDVEPAPVIEEPLSLDAELSHLRRAQAALRDGDPALALRLMDELDGARASAALSVERSVTRVLSLCALGRQADAERVARAVSQKADGAVYRQRLQASCAQGALASVPSDETPSVQTQNIDSNRKEQ